LNNKKIISLFICCFILPLLLAFILLKSDWLPDHKVNNGYFLESQVTLVEWQKISPKQWSILQKTENTCAAQCLANNQQMTQIANALGKYKDKVDLVLLTNSPSIHGLKSYPIQSQALQLNTLYLVDRFGLVVLAYPLSDNPQKNQDIKRGLIKDLKKLFKYARSA